MKTSGRKKCAAALLALILCVSALPMPAYAAEPLEYYEDLDPSEWYASGIRYCLEYGLMGGYGFVNHPAFGPSRLMTRAQLVVTLWRMEGAPVIGLTMQYHDVADDDWYADAARWALSTGIMGGYDAVTFGPGDGVTREQFASILWRYAAYRNGMVAVFTDAECEKFSDRDLISEYAVPAMNWACGMGILLGVTDRQGWQWAAPRSKVTRASAAVMLMRFCLDMG